jgi:hypothetical protein
LENPQDPKSPGKETQTSQEIRVSHRWFLTMVDWSIWKINHWYFLQLQICEYLIDVDGKLNVCPFARNIYIYVIHDIPSQTWNAFAWNENVNGCHMSRHKAAQRILNQRRLQLKVAKYGKILTWVWLENTYP